ncbi:MAG TPA: sulfotransferase family 2 domain-containing protein [Cytophaga sp.]|jgi:hypothetical protein|nr:sulfotransferase family 2 domain-containing protein [Cytophaga sp.]
MRKPLIISIHNFKTAGETFYSFIDRQFKKEEILNTNLLGHEIAAYSYLNKCTKEEKDEMKIVHGHFHFGIHECFSQKYTYITFVRSPIERVVSDYYYCRHNPLAHNYEFASKLSLKEYLQCDQITNIDNGQTRFIAGDKNILFGETSTAMLDKALKNLTEKFSFIGITEKFDESVVIVNRLFSWNKYYYKSKNVSQNKIKISIDELDEETMELLKERNNLDIKLYEYALRNHEEAKQATSFYIFWFMYLKATYKLYNIIHPAYSKIIRFINHA